MPLSRNSTYKAITGFILSIDNAYSVILFSNNGWLGLALLVATMFSPLVGLCGLGSLITALLVSRLTGFEPWDSKSGVLGLNSLITGLAVGYYLPISMMISHTLLCAGFLVVVSCATLFVYILLNWFTTTRLGLPSMSITFSLMAVLVWLGFNKMGFFAQPAIHKPLLTEWTPNVSEYLNGYLHSMGTLVFMPYAVAGIIVAIVLLLSTRIGFLLSVMGWTICHLLMKLFHYNTGNAISYEGFNLILVFLSIGGFFLIPSISSGFYALMAAVIAFLVTMLIPQLNPYYLPPVFALPFNITVLLMVFVLKLRLTHTHPYINDLSMSTPEKSMEHYLTRLKRFTRIGVPQFSLPFSGEWLVTQGFNGEFTHKYEWAYAWDFEIWDTAGKCWSENEFKLTDYYCWGKPVMASADGTVAHVLATVHDNALDEINTKDNWGNYVTISHGYGLYTLYAHLKQSSILVKPGDIVKQGDKLGLVGNSGRSPHPHLHFQVQLGAAAGNKTKYSHIVNYKYSQSPGQLNFISSGIPREGQFISSLLPAANLQETLGLQYFQTGEFEVIQGKKSYVEKWNIDLNFYGVFHINSDQGNALEFSVYNGIYNTLGLSGRKLNALFAYAMLISRLPYVEGQNVSWKDNPSLSVGMGNFWKHFILLISPIVTPVQIITESASREAGNSILLESKTTVKAIGLKLWQWHGSVEIEKKQGLRKLTLYKNKKLLLEANANNGKK